MKKMIIAVIHLITVIFICSCSSGEVRSVANDDKTANQKFEMIIEALENKNADELTKLFSENAINNDDDFNEKVDSLFEYYHGDLVSYDDWDALAVYDSVNESGDNRRVKSYDLTYDVETTEQKYRFAIHYVIEDTADKNNVGIWSLYIIKAEDDTDLRFAYRGDGKDTPGININVKNDIPEE